MGSAAGLSIMSVNKSIFRKYAVEIDDYAPTREEIDHAAQKFYNEYMSARYCPSRLDAGIIAKLSVRMKEMG